MAVAGVKSNDGMKCSKLKDGDRICNCTLRTPCAILLLISLLLAALCAFANLSLFSSLWISYIITICAIDRTSHYI